MDEYQPIACAQHERLEFAVLKHISLQLSLNDSRSFSGLALDVYTQAGAEWLKIRDVSGAEQVIRLDQIASFSEI